MRPEDHIDPDISFLENYSQPVADSKSKSFLLIINLSGRRLPTISVRVLLVWLSNCPCLTVLLQAVLLNSSKPASHGMIFYSPLATRGQEWRHRSIREGQETLQRQGGSSQGVSIDEDDIKNCNLWVLDVACDHLRPWDVQISLLDSSWCSPLSPFMIESGFL